MWQFWLIAAGVFFIAEMITVGFFVFWLAIGALLAMLTSFITDSIVIQIAVFIISSSILLFFTKPLVNKWINKEKTVKTNAYSIIGKQAIVTEDINPQKGLGQVTIEGEIWSAKTVQEEKIKKGQEVEITDIQGVKAIVKPIYLNEIIQK